MYVHMYICMLFTPININYEFLNRTLWLKVFNIYCVETPVLAFIEID